VQATSGTQGTVVDSRNPIPGLIGLTSIGVGLHQVRQAQERVRQAEAQYVATQQRVVAYQTIQNELLNRASLWTKFMAWVNG
jgi:hypothetical protein